MSPTGGKYMAADILRECVHMKSSCFNSDAWRSANGAKQEAGRYAKKRLQTPTKVKETLQEAGREDQHDLQVSERRRWIGQVQARLAMSNGWLWLGLALALGLRLHGLFRKAATLRDSAARRKAIGRLAL